MSKTLNLQKRGKSLYLYRGNSRILIVGQAPGIKAMERGKCWDDQSGKRLRAWMGNR